MSLILRSAAPAAAARRRQRGFIMTPFIGGSSSARPFFNAPVFQERSSARAIVSDSSRSSPLTLLTPIQDPFFANVVLLLHGEGANGGTTFTDSSGSPKTQSANSNVTTDTTRSKFGTSSIKSATTTAHLDYASSTDFQFDGDFTYEGFFWVTSLAATGAFYLTDLFATGRMAIGTNGTVSFVRNSGVNPQSAASVIVTGQWQFIAFSYQSASHTSRIYVDGTLVATDLLHTTTAYGAAEPFSVIGEPANTTTSLVGNVCEVRITKGIARYTGSSMTVPIAAFPNS